MKQNRSLLSLILVCALAFSLLCGTAFATAAPAEEAAPDGVSGASDVVDPELQMPQEEIRALILDYLRGFPIKTNEEGETEWAYREMYAIATSHEGIPGLSTVEFVLDPETMYLYAACEKGTEKVVHIPENPNVVMYWYHQVPEEEYIPQVNDYFSSYGVQIRGTARLMEPGEEKLYHVGALYMRSLYGAERWDAMSEEEQRGTIDKICGWNEWIEVMPTQYNVTSLWWVYNKEESLRPAHYDPESPYYGYQARQVYYVDAQ